MEKAFRKVIAAVLVISMVMSLGIFNVSADSPAETGEITMGAKGVTISKSSEIQTVYVPLYMDKNAEILEFEVNVEILDSSSIEATFAGDAQLAVDSFPDVEMNFEAGEKKGGVSFYHEDTSFAMPYDEELPGYWIVKVPISIPANVTGAVNVKFNGIYFTNYDAEESEYAEYPLVSDSVTATITVSEPADPDNPKFTVFYQLEENNKTNADNDKYYEVPFDTAFTVGVYVKADSEQVMQAFDIYPEWADQLSYVANSLNPAEGVAIVSSEMEKENPHFLADITAENSATPVNITTEGTKIATFQLKLSDEAVYDTPYGIFFDSDTNLARQKNAESVDVSYDTTGETFGVETRVSYTVKYNDNVPDAEIAVPDDALKGYNAELALDFINVGTRDGYTFAGWTATEDGTTAEYTAAGTNKYTANGTADGAVINLYAVWNPNTASITFDSNGGSAVATITANVGASVNAPAEPTMTGYTFTGWYDSEDNKVTFPVTMPVGGMALTAKWNIQQFTITFDTDGGTEINAKTQDYNTPVEKPADPEKTGHTFAGWDTNGDGVADTFPTTMPAQNITAKALWNVNQYTVTFKDKDGSQLSTATVAFNTKATRPATDPTKTGYTFENWYADAEFKNPFDFDTPITENTDIFAKWTPYTYTVTFNKNADDATGTMADQSFEYDESKALTANGFTREGWAFIGWATTPDGDVEYGNDPVVNLTTVNNGKVTLYAVWSKDAYEISYQHNPAVTNPTGMPPASYLNSTGLKIENVPTAKGYKFLGWTSTELGITELAMTVDIPDGTEKNITLTAHWEKVTYKIEYELDGGTNATGNPGTFDIESGNITLADPTKTGYDFGGWYTNADFTSESKVTEIKAETAADVKLYANWTPIEYTITYELNGGTNADGNPAKYTIETDTITLADPTKTGHTFAGWFIGEDEVEQIEKGSTGNVTLTASWTVNKYTVEFVTGETGTIDSITNVEYTGKVNLPDGSGLNKPGYVVEGWTDVENGTEVKYQIGENDALTADNGVTVQLYPVWKEATYKLTFDLGDEKYYDTEDEDNIAISDKTEVATFGGFYPELPTVAMNPGYEFVGWYYINAEDEEVVIKAGEETTTIVQITADTELTAKYKATEYTITFDLDGGAWKETPVWTEDVTFNAEELTLKYTIESTAVLPEAMKTGYNFNNWIVGNIDADTACVWEDGKEIEEGTAITGYYGNFTLKANFESPFTFEISEYKYAMSNSYLLRIATEGNDYAYSIDGVKMYYTNHDAYMIDGSPVFVTLISSDYVEGDVLTDEAMRIIAKGAQGDAAETIDRLGYVNTDGVINIADANAVYQMVIGTGGYYSEEQLGIKGRLEADMDGAGEKYGSIADVNAIVNIINNAANPNTSGN